MRISQCLRKGSQKCAKSVIHTLTSFLLTVIFFVNVICVIIIERHCFDKLVARHLVLDIENYMYATCMIVNVIKDLLIGEKSKVIKKSLREKCVVSEFLCMRWKINYGKGFQ